MRWYQTYWGVILLGLGGVVVLLLAVFGVITVKYWWQIKQGRGDLLLQQVYGGFTPVQNGNSGKEKVDRAVLENGDFPFLGIPNASTTIVVFGEFRCPYTKQVMPILKQLADKYGYKLKLVFRNFPAESIPGHQGTNKLSQIGICAHKQGQDKYWKVSDYLFAKQDNLPVVLGSQDLADLAGATGVDLTELNQCLSSSATAFKVNQDYSDGYRFGVGGTPTFFVNGQKVEGVVPLATWEDFIKQL